MKFKLYHKVILFSVIMIVLFIISIILLIIFSNKKFDDYIRDKEIEKLGYLINTLEIYYSENGGWGDLINNDLELWDTLLERGWRTDNINQVDQIKDDTEGNNKFVTLTFKIDYYPLPIWDPLNLGARVSLFDENKKFIVGHRKSSIQEHTILPVKLSGKVVGWLGLRDDQEIYQPIDQTFRQKQSTLIYLISGVFLFILISSAILFSKYILMPLTRLVGAFNNLGHLNFNTQIPIESSDEIGELALHFNNITQKLEKYAVNQKQLFMDISHELRTPLSVLACEVGALKDGVKKPEKALFLSLSQEIRHLIKLVNDINEISLIDAGMFSIEKRVIKLLPILSGQVYIFIKRFEINNISVEVDFEPEAADMYMEGDPDRLIQLFSNIMENVIRYTEKPGKLSIRQSHNADYMEIIFEDSGPGVPDDSLPFLFNRLYRVDKSRSRKDGGNGLGLAICKAIVEMHNGIISAQNVQGGGLMIKIQLPIKHDACGEMIAS